MLACITLCIHYTVGRWNRTHDPLLNSWRRELLHPRVNQILKAKLINNKYLAPFNISCRIKCHGRFFLFTIKTCVISSIKPQKYNQFYNTNTRGACVRRVGERPARRKRDPLRWRHEQTTPNTLNLKHVNDLIFEYF